jgi:glycosyltransferase involved in cell wall biosynthesis
MNEENITPLVSIVIPCYNYEKYVGQCIKSVLSQTYKNLELIVIDNGSTDNSLEVIRSFSGDDRLKIIKFKENIKPWTDEKSIAIGIEQSNGDYISVLYADDWYLPDKIRSQIDLFNNSPTSVGVVYCHGYFYSEQNQKMNKWKHQSVRGYVFKDYLLNGDVVIPISPLVKRYCYDIIGLDNLWTGSEYDYLLMSQYVDFDFVDKNLVVMRMHDKNDAKNVYSVYRRVKRYHEIALLNKNTLLRGGKLVNRRISKDLFEYGLTFITMKDTNTAREAILEAIKIYPKFLFRPKMIASLVAISIPVFLLEYLLKIKKNFF